MIRDFHSDPLPQGCPFSFISVLKKKSGISTEAFLGGLQYKKCQVTEDWETREIKDWFAFSLDEKTCGLWGYFDQKIHFKVHAGGRKITSSPNGGDDIVEGKDQSLLELYNTEENHGLLAYVKMEGEEQPMPESGLYIYSKYESSGLTIVCRENESSFYGFNVIGDGKGGKDSYNYTLEASDSKTLWQLWSSFGFYYATYTAKDKVGHYQSCEGDANFYGTFVKSGESSYWGYTNGNWHYKLEAKGSASAMYFWHGGSDDPNDEVAAFAKIYAYTSSAGFSCCKTDEVHSTLEPSSLFCVDKTNKKKSTYYAGGAFLGHDNDVTYTYIEGYTVWVVDKNSAADGKLYPGWMGIKKFDKSFCYIDGSYIWVGGNGNADAKIYPGEIWAKTSGGGQFSAVGGTMTLSYGGSNKGTYEPGAITLTGGGTVSISASDLGGKTAYFRQVTVCENGSSKTAYFLMTDPV
jgi:hypothetical protein